MRYYEFASKLNEDLSEESLRSLISIINFEQSRIDSEDANPKISPSKLITMMQNIGFESYNFRDLLAAYNDSPNLQSLISKPEKNQMIDLLPDSGTEDMEAGTDLSAMPAGPMPAQPGMEEPITGDLENQTSPQMPVEEPPISSEPSGPIGSPQGTEQTVQSMAKKALKRRQ